MQLQTNRFLIRPSNKYFLLCFVKHDLFFKVFVPKDKMQFIVDAKLTGVKFSLFFIFIFFYREDVGNWMPAVYSKYMDHQQTWRKVGCFPTPHKQGAVLSEGRFVVCTMSNGEKKVMSFIPMQISYLQVACEQEGSYVWKKQGQILFCAPNLICSGRTP